MEESASRMIENKGNLKRPYYGATRTAETNDPTSTTTTTTTPVFSASRRKRAWSVHETSSLLVPSLHAAAEADGVPQQRPSYERKPIARDVPKGGFLYYLVYAAVNIIISVPGLCT
jgi:hypothetical protein